MNLEGESIATKISKVERAIDKVEEDIEKVEQRIEKIEEKLEDVNLSEEDIKYYRTEKQQLRTEKQLHLTKEQQLRTKEQQYLTEKQQLVTKEQPPRLPTVNKADLLPDVERLLPLMSALPAVIREVGIFRRSRLNCWEKESMRTSGSKRSKRFRRKVIGYYKRASNSGKKVKCQILDEYILNNEAEDEATGIIAAHIWKASTRGHGLGEFGLRLEDVNSPRNGLFLTKGLEDAFDHQQICFLYNLLENKIVLWVADTSLMRKTIAGSGKTTTDGSGMTFSDVHQKPLLCPRDCLPFRRLLSWHARLTLELWPQTVDDRQLASAYDNSPGRENVVIDPITRAISEMVEPGDNVSTDHSSNQ